MLKQICEWNDFVIFHENITVWVLTDTLDVHSDLLLNLSLIHQLKFFILASNEKNLSWAANYLTVDTIWFDI